MLVDWSQTLKYRRRITVTRTTTPYHSMYQPDSQCMCNGLSHRRQYRWHSPRCPVYGSHDERTRRSIGYLKWWVDQPDRQLDYHPYRRDSRTNANRYRKCDTSVIVS